jgi:hypothetical protein
MWDSSKVNVSGQNFDNGSLNKVLILVITDKCVYFSWIIKVVCLAVLHAFHSMSILDFLSSIFSGSGSAKKKEKACLIYLSPPKWSKLTSRVAVNPAVDAFF